MKFCKNCGHEIRPDAKVCTNCGHDLSADNNRPKRQPEQRKPMDPKKKKLITIITAGVVVIAIILAVAYSLIAGALSPNNQMDTIAEAVSEEDGEALRSAVDNDITLEEAEAYIAYVDQVSGFSQYDTWIEDAKTTLDDGAPGSEVFDGLYTLLSVAKDGSQYLFFDDHSFTIPRINVYAYEDYSMEEFVYTMDETEYRWDADNEKFAELIPGLYNFEGSAVIDDESYDSAMSIDFQNGESAVLNPGFYYLNINESVTSMYFEDVDEDSLSVSVNGEEVDLNTDDHSERIGPYLFGEDLDVTAIIEHGGETFESENGTIQLNVGDVEMDYSTGEAAPVHPVELEFDNDAIYDAGEAERNQAQLEEEREEFEENLEDHVETFIDDYLFALEMMYMFEDINEVDDYMDQDSNAYETLESNIDSGVFEGMYISNVSYSNYTRDGNTITVDVESERDYDSLESSAEIVTQYTLEYDPDELEFEITGFQDL